MVSSRANRYNRFFEGSSREQVMGSPVRHETVQLRVRLAEEKDVELLWQWANDPDVRRNSFSPEEIPIQRHREWFLRKIGSPATRIYVIERQGKPVGQVRYDRANGREAEIDVSIAAEHRGSGLGTEALAATKERALKDLEVESVVGIVMKSNTASCSAFQRAGFTEEEPQFLEGHDCRVFRWPPRSNHERGNAWEELS